MYPDSSPETLFEDVRERITPKLKGTRLHLRVMPWLHQIGNGRVQQVQTLLISSSLGAHRARVHLTARLIGSDVAEICRTDARHPENSTSHLTYFGRSGFNPLREICEEAHLVIADFQTA